jgi:3-dehydroquinate synthetase
MSLSERRKIINSVLDICGAAQDFKLDRHSLLVAIGGGECSDVVGFAASIIRRGVGHVRIPTTLVGQIDAGIGLKTGVNLRCGKHFLGSFHPPEQVLIDPAFLATLPACELRQWLSEMIKIALVRDADLFERVAVRWSQVLGTKVTATQVGLCLIDLKPARLVGDPKHLDSLVDVAGYAACVREVSR